MPASSPRPRLLSLASAPSEHEILADLRRHLAPLRSAGALAFREISPMRLRTVASLGAIAPLIEYGKLAASDLFMPLLSADFLANPGCRRLLRSSLEMAREGRLELLPVLARPVDLGPGPLRDATVLPRDGRALSLNPNRDAALASLVEELREHLQLPSALGAPAPPPSPSRRAGKARSADSGEPRLRHQPRRRGALRVLCIFANPSDLELHGLDRLDLGREQAEIDRLQRHHDSLEFECRQSATLADLHAALLERDYDIVHVSGHYEPQRGLLLADEGGRSHRIDLAPLVELIASRPRVRCLILNACNSYTVAERCTRRPDIIAMRGAISDRMAIEFSRHFYRALAHGVDISRAFDDCRCLMRCDCSKSQPHLYRASL